MDTSRRIVGERRHRVVGRASERGQVLAIFALMSVVLLGGAALITDVAWWWTFEQRMQRAADAAALAGAIYLPGNQARAFSLAISEAAKNGFVNGQGGVTVVPRRDPGGDPRKLVVDIDGSVRTNFAQVFCWEGGPCLRNVAVGVTGAASYVLPVPMGSPENYYGVFGKLRTPNGGTTTYSSADTGWVAVPTAKGSTNWGGVANVALSDDQRATSNANGQSQQWGFTSGITFPGNLDRINGIEFAVEARTTAGSACQVQAQLSWDDGANWTTSVKSAPASGGLGTSDPPSPYFVLGNSADGWGRTTWSAGDFAASRFRVRLTNVKPNTCTGTTEVDHIRVRVHYRTATFIADANVRDPYNGALAPRGLWGTFINQGAEKVNGDAYLPKWDPRTSRQNAQYDPALYYHYALEIPAGGSNGELWIYDPVFCATDGSGQYGTGDRWFGGSSVSSAYYTLYDTRNTPYLMSDDVPVPGADSGSLFANIRASDATLGGPTGSGIASCAEGATTNQSDGRYWHNRWWRIASGLEGGKTYRLHTRSTDPSSSTAMDNANGHNSFALWSRAQGASPRIYGIGAMQAFTPLDGGYNASLGCAASPGCAEFYLAQIDAEHAGKTMVIQLWDPGDTGSLPATLSIRRPAAGGYEDATFSYSAERVASGAVDCSNRRGINVTSVQTNTGNSSQFNGCWLTIEIPLPSTYDAPQPPGETEAGWWKIRYIMGGQASDNAFDLTTWQVTLRGNPVHLVTN